MNVGSPILTRAEEISPEMKAYYANRPLMWRNLAMFMLLNLGWSLCFNFVGPLMTLRLSQLGMNSAGLGWWGGVNIVGTGFLTMYFAWKSDHTVTRWGRRMPYLFFSAPFVILTVIVFPLISVLWILVTVWLLQAVFRDAEGATIPLLSVDCMPRRLLARMSAPLSIMFGIIGFVGIRYGMRLAAVSQGLPYYVGAGIVLATTLAGFGIREPPVKVAGRKERFKPWSAMEVAWQDRRTILLMVSVGLLYGGPVVWSWTWLYAFNTLHLSRPVIGVIMAWPQLVGIATAWPVAWLADRVSPYKLVPVYWLLCGLPVLLLWLVPTETGLLWSVCAFAMFAPLFVAFNLMVYRNEHPNKIGSVTSTLSFVMALCNGVTSVISGLIIQGTGNNYLAGILYGWLLMAAGVAGLYTYRHWVSSSAVLPVPVPVEAGEGVATANSLRPFF